MKEGYFVTQDLNGNQIMLPEKDINSESFYDFNKGWTDEMEEYKLKRVRYLKETIEKVDRAINESKDDYQKIMFEFFKDELLMDLREDEQLIEYKGAVPKHINKRAMKKCAKIYQKWRDRLGTKNFDQLKEDVDVAFRKKIVFNVDSASGSGRM